MKKLIKSKEFKLALTLIIIVGLGIVIYGIPVMLMKNKSANKIVTNQGTELNQSTVEIKAVYLISTLSLQKYESYY